jgi:HK97 family phage prohead protease
MNTLDFQLDVKAVDDDGLIEGVAAGYGDVDHGDDLIIPGAAAKSLAGRARVPMLLFHDQKRPVGVWSSLTETGDGLLAKGRFAMSTSAGKEAHALTRDGALSGLSIGYRTLKHRMQGKVRELQEIAVHEISLVAIPMHQRAQITAVKSILEAGELPTIREFEEFLRDAGGFSKSLAAAIAGKATPHLRGEPEAKANDAVEFLRALQAG